MTTLALSHSDWLVTHHSVLGTGKLPIQKRAILNTLGPSAKIWTKRGEIDRKEVYCQISNVAHQIVWMNHMGTILGLIL